MKQDKIMIRLIIIKTKWILKNNLFLKSGFLNANKIKPNINTKLEIKNCGGGV